MFEENDRIPVFDEKLSIFVKCTPHQVKNNPDCVRLACNLFQITNDGEKRDLAYVRVLCKKGINYTKYIQENAQNIFLRKMRDNPECEQAYREIYGGSNPFSKFVGIHFDNIAQLHGWQPSTIINYRNTLLQLARFVPNSPIPLLRGIDFDIVIQKAEEKFRAEQVEKHEKDSGYSDSRLGQFLNVLFAVMEYAASNYDIENPMLKSERYRENRSKFGGKGVKIKPIETLIEKRLRMKGLETESQVSVAREIGDLIYAGTDPMAIGVGVQMLAGLRPSEVCGLQYGAIYKFTREGWEHRSYLLVHTKIDYRTGNPSNKLKTVHAYRAVPIQITLQKWLDEHVAQVSKNICNYVESGFEDQYIVSKDWKGEKPVKTKDFCRRSAQILQEGAKDSKEFLGIQIPVDYDDDGNQIVMEENKSAYQYRRNFGSIMLSTLGIKHHAVQCVFGHKPTKKELRKWLSNHEDELIRLLQEMDKFVLCPAKNEVEQAEKPWSRRDYREKPIKLVDGFGEFKNVPALVLYVEPYSEEDQVTLRLLVKPNEPGDKLEFKVSSEQSVQVTVDEFCSKSKGADRLNLENDYLDMVFAKEPHSTEESEGGSVDDDEELFDMGTDTSEEQEEISEMYILDEENEMSDFEEVLDISEEDDGL